jgi:hypothetical protein
MSDLGLVSVLPVGAFVGVGCLTISFCLTLWRLPSHGVLLGAHVMALILMLFGTPAILEEVPRFTVSWRHVGIAELVARTGMTRPDLDVYGNWPGFFVFLAFLSRAADMPSLLGLAEWASVIFNALYLGPLLFLYRSIAGSPQTIWLSVWIFYSANWIAQDYLAPQAFGFLLYLTSLALLFNIYSGRTSASSWPDSSLARHSAAPIIVVMLLALASVPTHQLTPVQLTITLAGLALVWRPMPSVLPILVACAIAGWAVFMATAYLDGHLTDVVSDVGKVGSSVEEGVSNRIAGSEGHLFVVRTRLTLSYLIGLLAVAGALRLLIGGGKKALDRGFTVLAIAPVLLPALQSYGGEVGLRAFFFALPALAYFAANLFYPHWMVRARFRVAAATAVVLLVIVGAFWVARYGNERADLFTRDEVRAFDYFYEHASPKAVLGVAAANAPWKYEQYELHEYVVANRLEGWDEASESGEWDSFLADLSARITRPGVTSYVVVTRSEKAGADLVGDRPGSVADFEKALRQSDRFRVVFANSDAVVVAVRRAS